MTHRVVVLLWLLSGAASVTASRVEFVSQAENPYDIPYAHERNMELELLLNNAEQYAATGDFQSAAILLKKILKMKPYSASAGLMLAECYLELGQAENALNLMNQLTRAREDLSEAYLLRGRAQMVLGKYTEAVESFRSVMELEPGNVTAAQQLGLALSALGRMEEAIALYKERLLRNPSSLNDRMALGALLGSTGHLDEGIRHFELALKQHPENADLHSNLSVLYAAKGEREIALKHAKKAVELNPTSGDAYNNLGVMLVENQQFEEALAAYQSALKQKVVRPSTHRNIATVLAYLGEEGRALDHCETYMESVTPDATMLNYTGVLYLRQRQFDKAESLFRRAIVRDSNWSLPFLYMGLLCNETGRVEEAVRFYQQGLELQPNHAMALNNLAWILCNPDYTTLFNPQRAVELAQKACALTRFSNDGFVDTLETACEALPDDKGKRAALRKAAVEAENLGATQVAEALFNQAGVRDTN